MKMKLFIVAILLCLASANLNAEVLAQEINIKGIKWSVVGKTTTDSIPKAHKDGIWWGVEFSEPISVIDRLEIKKGDTKIPVRLSAYADLANVKKIEIKKQGKMIVVQIQGGDAAGAFVAEIMIKNDKVVERTVRNAEFPERVLERDIYY